MNHFSDEPVGDDWENFKAHVKENLIPQIEGSSLFVTIVPSGEVDIKFAIELGLSIMYDKPLIAVIPPGRKISEKLARVVDRFVEFDVNDASQHDRLAAVISEVAADTLKKEDK